MKDTRSGQKRLQPVSSRRNREYLWGSLRPTGQFPEKWAVAPVGKWFEAMKEARHEVTHLAQDVFSNYGCWTYYLGERILDEVFRISQENPRTPKEVCEGVIPLAQLRRCQQMRVTATEHNPRSGTHRIQKLKLTEILETDAMCSVFDGLYIGLIEGVFDRDEVWRIIVEHELNYAVYPRKYMIAWEWFQRIVGLDRATFIAHREDPESGERRTSMYYTFRIFLDFALSVPCEVIDCHPVELNPAKRFLLAVTGVMSLPKPSRKFLNRVMEHPDEVFGTLDKLCRHSHSSWEAIADWMSALEKRYELTQDPIALLRRSALLRKRQSYGEFLLQTPSHQTTWAGVPTWFRDGRIDVEPTTWEMPFSLEQYNDRLESHEWYLLLLEFLARAKRITVDAETCRVELNPRVSRRKSIGFKLDCPLRRDIPAVKIGANASHVLLDPPSKR